MKMMLMWRNGATNDKRKHKQQRNKHTGGDWRRGLGWKGLDGVQGTSKRWRKSTCGSYSVMLHVLYITLQEHIADCNSHKHVMES